MEIVTFWAKPDAAAWKVNARIIIAVNFIVRKSFFIAMAVLSRHLPEKKRTIARVIECG
ncbi:hypothetical protein D3C87_2080100 [compost metagenome]